MAVPPSIAIHQREKAAREINSYLGYHDLYKSWYRHIRTVRVGRLGTATVTTTLPRSSRGRTAGKELCQEVLHSEVVQQSKVSLSSSSWVGCR